MNGNEGVVILMIAVAGIIYFAPTFIAVKRDHPNMTSILLLNLFLGWSFIGWVIALIWSFSATSIVVTSEKEENKTLPKKPVENESIACPFCAEKILSKAILCKHCGSKLDKELLQQ